MMLVLLFSISAGKYRKPLEEKLDRCRFYLWNHRQPYTEGEGRYTLYDDHFSKTIVSHGAEVLDPMAGDSGSAYDNTKDTIMLAHGFSDKAPSKGIDKFIKGLKKGGKFEDYNVIGMDWRFISAIQTLDVYRFNANSVGVVGEHFAEMLELLIEDGTITNFDRIHAIGHSLGAHVVGNMGRHLRKKYHRTLRHITALDPAGPRFVDDANEDLRIKKSDAHFVEAMHTNGAINRPFLVRNYYGDARPDLADTNWYMNGGQRQPGCHIPPCAHCRVWDYLGEIAADPRAFRGFECDIGPRHDWRGWKFPHEGCLKKLVKDSHDREYMKLDYGSHPPRGDYIVMTSKHSPFSSHDWNKYHGKKHRKSYWHIGRKGH